MIGRILAPAFQSYMAAQFSPDKNWKQNVPIRQQLEMEDSFYCGAQAVFRGMVSEEAMIMIEAELEDFGEIIVERYVNAGLIKL